MNKLYMLLFTTMLTLFAVFISCGNHTVYSSGISYSINNDDEAEYNGYIVSVEPGRYQANLADDSYDEYIEAPAPLVKDANIYLADTVEEIINISRLGTIQYIEPNYKVYLTDTDFDTYADADYDFSKSWNLSMIGADLTLRSGYRGDKVRIGIIDSGLNTTHIEIKDSVGDGYNVINDSTDVSDNLGHGSFVSGIIAAGINGSSLTGVAPESEIVPIKAFESTNTNTSNIIKAIYAAVNNLNCDILNMSFALKQDSTSVKAAIEYAAEKGVLMAAAVGNSTTSGSLMYPAAYDCVIGVGSVDYQKVVAPSSIKNTSVFVVAPGVNVSSISNSSNTDYSKGSGTSYAAPHVSAMLAVLKSVDKDLDIETAKNILMNTSEDIYSKGYDINSGYGIINVSRGVVYLLELKPSLRPSQSQTPGADVEELPDVYAFDINTELENGVLTAEITLNNNLYNDIALIFALKNDSGELYDIRCFDTGMCRLKKFECSFDINSFSAELLQNSHIEAFVWRRDTMEPVLKKLEASPIAPPIGSAVVQCCSLSGKHGITPPRFPHRESLAACVSEEDAKRKRS